MLFNSLTFLIFFVVVYSAYLCLFRRLKAQNFLLLIASFVFYGAWDWRFLFLLIVSMTFDYTMARLIAATPSASRKRGILAFAISVELLVLGFFKYFNWGIASMATLLGYFGIHSHAPVLHIILPVGLSFYTFQTISYLVDVYRGDVPASRNFVEFACYVCYFPQLVAGPIEKATALLPQIQSPRRVTRADLQAGLMWILLGYFKKTVIADSMAPMVSQAFDNPSSISGISSLLAVVAFAIQIYGDFSGYTLIARGVSQLMGIRLMRNFNAPYLARNPRDFWARWHISLSSWLRQYLYIGLGGSRKGTGRTYINLMATMLLGGLWHGANWTFVIWGFYHGLLLVGCHFLNVGRQQKHKHPVMAVMEISITFVLTLFGWLLFRANNMGNVADVLSNIWNNFHWTAEVASFLIPTAFSLILLQTYHAWQELTGDDMILLKINPWYRATIYFAIVLCLLAVGVRRVPFIYFQF